MTNEEAIIVLKYGMKYRNPQNDTEKDRNEAIEMAISALMNRPTATLDEIKAEIDREYEELDGYDPLSLGTFAEKVDDIIDKYKAEDRPKGEGEPWKRN